MRREEKSDMVGVAEVICTYDNPATMARECWQDGRLFYSYSCQLFPPYAKSRIPGALLFFGANIGEWEPGRMVGDAEAIGER